MYGVYVVYIVYDVCMYMCVIYMYMVCIVCEIWYVKLVCGMYRSVCYMVCVRDPGGSSEYMYMYIYDVYIQIYMYIYIYSTCYSWYLPWCYDTYGMWHVIYVGE